MPSGYCSTSKGRRMHINAYQCISEQRAFGRSRTLGQEAWIRGAAVGLTGVCMRECQQPCTSDFEINKGTWFTCTASFSSHMQCRRSRAENPAALRSAKAQASPVQPASPAACGHSSAVEQPAASLHRCRWRVGNRCMRCWRNLCDWHAVRNDMLSGMACRGESSAAGKKQARWLKGLQQHEDMSESLGVLPPAARHTARQAARQP